MLGTYGSVVDDFELQCLDTGADFPKNFEDDSRLALAFARTLLQLLASLSEPIIPVSLHARCAQVTSRDAAFEVRRQQLHCGNHA